MKIILAPNAFKGSLTAASAALAMERGILAAHPDIVTVRVPVADGGDGLVNIALENLDAEERRVTVRDPLGRPVSAAFAWLPSRRTAFVELALASGLALLNDSERNPLKTITFGTGELAVAALELGATSLYFGIGGSATNDGAVGLASALGIRFLDEAGNEVEPVGGELVRIRGIDMSRLHPGLKECSVHVICDVENPLLGPSGAARVYAPQKGATPEQVEALETGLANLAEVMRRELGVDVRDLPGGGAAGGVGAGLHAFFHAELKRGIDTVLELVDFEQKIEGADLILTAEGRIDGQTACGKAPAGVARIAEKHGIPCIALAGGLGDGFESLHGIGMTAVFSICSGPVSLENAMRNADAYLRSATEQVVRAFIAGQGQGMGLKRQYGEARASKGSTK
jgi:glycerate kinase